MGAHDMAYIVNGSIVSEVEAGLMRENFKEIYVIQIRVKHNPGEYGKWHDYLCSLSADEATSYMKDYLENFQGRTLPDVRVVHRVTYDETL